MVCVGIIWYGRSGELYGILIIVWYGIYGMVWYGMVCYVVVR